MTDAVTTSSRKDSGTVRRIATYRMISLGLAVGFACVGLLFLLFPGTVLRFFNGISVSIGLEATSVEGAGFYLVLAVGYMYLVALLAWFMFRDPGNRAYSLLLVNAKLASSILSIVFFLCVSRALIYLANGLVDGLIGAGVFWMYRKQKGLE